VTVYTLTEAKLAQCQPRRAGERLRAVCPFHGGDHQRSLSVHIETGWFRCFACPARGQTEEGRKRWQDENGIGSAAKPARRSVARPKAFPALLPPAPQKPLQPALTGLDDLLAGYQEALPGSPAEDYLRSRGIPLDLAERYGAGYAAPGTWPNRDCPGGRVVFPHTAPDGTLINLYGRAIHPDTPKPLWHDHLRGDKALFNAAALAGSAPLFVCEGAFDALSLLAAGAPSAVAVFGLAGWNWELVDRAREIVLAFDADVQSPTHTQHQTWLDLLKGGVERGYRISILEAACYGTAKDANEAWTSHQLTFFPNLTEDQQERAAILEIDGGLSRYEAELTARS
jgi:hypothetical protein